MDRPPWTSENFQRFFTDKGIRSARKNQAFNETYFSETIGGNFCFSRVETYSRESSALKYLYSWKYNFNNYQNYEKRWNEKNEKRDTRAWQTLTAQELPREHAGTRVSVIIVPFKNEKGCLHTNFPTQKDK